MRRALLGFSLLLLASQTTCAERGEESRPYKVVRPTVAFEMIHDDPDLLVLDLRTPREFNGPLGHLNGAVNVALDRIEESAGELARFRERTMLVYCRRGPCGAEGMRVLSSRGFEYINLMEGGIEAWLDAGFGTVHEDVPMKEAPDEETFEYDLDDEDESPPADDGSDESAVDEDRPLGR